MFKEKCGRAGAVKVLRAGTKQGSSTQRDHTG